MELTRRHCLQVVLFGATSVVVPPALSGCAGAAAPAAPAVAAAVPAIAAVLTSVAGWVGLEAAKETVAYWVENGWDRLIEADIQADPGSEVYYHPETQTVACSTAPESYPDLNVEIPLVAFWTPNMKPIKLQPRAAQALSRSVETLAGEVGFEDAALLLHPINALAEDDGTPPGARHRLVTYQARDGGTVQIAYNNGVESVTAQDHPGLHFEYAVDPNREFYLPA